MSIPSQKQKEQRASRSNAAAAPARLGSSTKAGLVMASGTIVSRLLGLLRTILLAAAIGVSGQVTDLWDLANVLPNQIYGLIAGGVFSAVLVPLIIKASQNADRGADYLSRLVTLLTTFLAIATVLATVSVPWIISALSQFTPAQEAVASQLAYFLFPQIFFYGMYAIFGQILNAHESYGPYMWSPVLNNLISMATLGVFIFMFGLESSSPHTLAEWTMEKTLVLTLGTTLGIVAQALVLFIPLRKLNLGLRPNFHFRGVGLRQAARLTGWTAATMVIGNLPFFVYNWVETSVTRYRETLNRPDYVVLGPGGLNSAALINMLPHAVIAVSLATILINRLSRAAANDDLDTLRRSLNSGLRTLGLPMILCASAIIVVAGPLGFIFAAGNGRAGALIGIATILFISTIPLFSATVFLSRTFYTLGDARTPFFITLFITTLSSVLALVCMMVPPEPRIFAVAIVTSLGNIIAFLINHVLLSRRLGSYRVEEVFDSWAKFTFAALLSALPAVGVLWLLGGYSESGFAWTSLTTSLVSCTLVGLVMSFAYVGILRLLKSPELGDVLDPLLRTIRR